MKPPLHRATRCRRTSKSSDEPLRGHIDLVRIREGAAAIEMVGPADLETAWQIGLDWKDQDFSIVDRTSLAVMCRLGMERAASLDDHFAVFRFGPQRRKSFTIIR